MLESQLHHRSRSVPSSTKLAFSSLPTSYTDLIAQLEPGNSDNRKFESLRTWLQKQRAWLEQLHPLGVKYADNHRDRLIEKVDYQLGRLIRLERACWDRAKVAAEIPGLYNFPAEEGAIMVAARTSIHLPHFRYLIPHK